MPYRSNNHISAIEERGTTKEKRVSFRWISSNKSLIFILIYSLESVYLLF